MSQIRLTALKLTGAATFTPSRQWPRRTGGPLFDINGGEVYGLELAPGMPLTAQVQFDSRLRAPCGLLAARRGMSQEAFHRGK